MKCINCGKELKDKAKFCDDCGSKQTIDEVIYETVKEKKSNKGLIITVIILGIVILSGIGVGTYLILSNKEEKKNNNTSNNIENNEIYENVKDEIVINGYFLTLPEGFDSYTSGSYNYITNNEITIVYALYPLTYKQLIDNKEYILDALKQQGYEVEEFNDLSNDEKKYITATGKMNSIQYGFVFYEIDSNTNLFSTITSNYLGNFKEEWFEKALEFFESATKEIN